MMKLTVVQLARELGAELIGADDKADVEITTVAAVATAGESDVTFVKSEKHAAAIGQSRAGAVIVGTRLKGVAMPQLVVEDVDAALIEALNVFAPCLKPAPQGVDPSARIGKNVRMSQGVCVGPGVVIDEEVEIGPDTVIGSGCRIGESSKIGRNCRLDTNVVVYHNCSLGNNVVIQANSTIGSMGFGYSFIDGVHRLIPHNGGVVIEDSVEIGANCCIDRAKFGNTIIGAGTKIDNLVQIAHNVVIGKCCLVAGQVGIAGSCRLGDGVVLAGQVGLADNIEVGAGTKIGAKGGVMSSVGPGQQLAWIPAVDKKKAFQVIGQVMRLPKMAEQLKRLAERVKKLESSKDHKE
ncbi:MAG: UDP-3-O-(3-hydroxymyristoyl)glucosamine N-acyltransferase [Phycisphaerales bacterium]|nr:MAG: UDP-3-O-(3-hydroxymyristoyl)glucosamine N-acyltransferase [Phycisphaerales bacterium]